MPPEETETQEKPKRGWRKYQWWIVAGVLAIIMIGGMVKMGAITSMYSSVLDSIGENTAAIQAIPNWAGTIQGMQGSIATMNADIATMNSDMVSHDAALAAVQEWGSNITALETLVDNLTAEVATLKAILKANNITMPVDE